MPVYIHFLRLIAQCHLFAGLILLCLISRLADLHPRRDDVLGDSTSMLRPGIRGHLHAAMRRS